MSNIQVIKPPKTVEAGSTTYVMVSVPEYNRLMESDRILDLIADIDSGIIDLAQEVH